MIEIIIKQKTFEDRPAGKEWKIINKENEYGYTPDIIKSVEVEKKLLTQEIDEIDLIAVIKAINNIK